MDQIINSDEKNAKLFGILSYLGPLVIIPLLLKREDAFIKFHIKQGLVVLTIEVIASVFFRSYWSIFMIYPIINLFTFVLIVLGIINVVKGQEKELPLVGGLADYFPV